MVDGFAVLMPCLIFLFGCIGGFVNALLTEEIKLPRKDENAGVFRPGWIGNVLVGGIAASVFWALYGNYGDVIIISAKPDTGLTNGAHNIGISIAEVAGAVVSGIGGGKLLTTEVDNRGLKNQNDKLNQAKNALATTVETLSNPEDSSEII